MKLQISFDLTDLDKAVEIGKHVEQYADILEVGTLLIYRHGIQAIQRFKETFPNKTILADTKIVDRGKEVVEIIAETQADWLTVMAGTTTNVIHATNIAARNKNMKVMLDLLDSSSVGQSALEAKNLGVDAILLHQPYDEKEALLFLDKWDMIKGNTNLPIFVSTKLNHENIDEVLTVKPDGIIIGKSITDTENPAQEAQYYAELIGKQ